MKARSLTMTTLHAALLAVYAFFCVLMVQISLQYTGLDPDAAFLRIKQTYAPHLWYRIAFFVHAFSALAALPAGLTQFSAVLRRRYPVFHRWMGRFYAGAILCLAGPSGLIIAAVANGGWASQLAFVLLALGWALATWLAWKYALERNWRLHRDWIIRSFALTLSAITLRAWKYALVAVFHPPPMDVYRLVAWLGWTVNLVVAEWIIYRKFYPNKSPLAFLLKKPVFSSTKPLP